MTEASPNDGSDAVDRGTTTPRNASQNGELVMGGSGFREPELVLVRKDEWEQLREAAAEFFAWKAAHMEELEHARRLVVRSDNSPMAHAIVDLDERIRGVLSIESDAT